jgi:hypothetical protein
MRLPATGPALGTRKRARLMFIVLTHLLQAAAWMVCASRQGRSAHGGQATGAKRLSPAVAIGLGRAVEVCATVAQFFHLQGTLR